MRTVHHYLSDRLHSKFIPNDLMLEPKKDYKRLVETEWSSLFESLMRSRLIMGAMRYETFAQKRKHPNTYNYLKETLRRLEAYQQTGNKEFLVDAANMCLLEFEFPFRQNTYFDNEQEHNIHAEKK